jgi:hypothetical protein
VWSGGAAISVRWGTPGNYKILVYDGGTAVSGELLVAHIRTFYLSGRVDYVVSSHAASDHMAGLEVVLRELDVGELWMHRPWAHGDTMRPEMMAGHSLECTARARGIPVHEPFAGAAVGPFTVMSPHRDWYIQALLPAFGEQAARPGALASFIRSPRRWARERFMTDAATTAENESSAVLYAEFDGRGVLLTGRAGAQALGATATQAERMGIDLPASLRLIQVPNHGRRKNMSRHAFDRILGRHLPRAQRQYTKSAFISVGIDAGGDVSQVVTGALLRRGALSFVTHGASLHHGHQMPYRGWRQARPASLQR